MKKLIILFLAAVILSGCIKNAVTLTPLASFNVTNAVVGGNTLSVNTSNITIVNNNSSEFPVLAGQSKLDLYDPADPAHPYYNQVIATASGSYYSLFLSGASPAQVDAVLVKDDFQNYPDSVSAVRFVNLSPGSNPVSVNVSGSANGSSVSSLAYKGYTAFLKYPIKTPNQSYTFEFRDAGTGALLASYTFNPLIFHNTTLVLAGLPAAQMVIENDNY